MSKDWQLGNEEDIDALEEWLSNLTSKDRTIVKVSLTGQVSLAQKARLDGILDHNFDLLAAVGGRGRDAAISW